MVTIREMMLEPLPYYIVNREGEKPKDGRTLRREKRAKQRKSKRYV